VICVTPVPAGQQTDKETQRIAEVKERISAVGFLEKKRVIITRRDSTKLRGRVSEIKEDSLALWE
jgi:hypothetical protein